MWNIMKLVVFSLLLLVFFTGCTEEQLIPDSIGIGYGVPYYEDTPMWRGFNINARWDL